jgi:mannosyltransferase OCH1-like enzyme
MNIISRAFRRISPEPGPTVTVPKILHKVWLGGKPFPERCQRLWDTWKRYNPEYQSLFWTEKNLPVLQNRKLFERATSYSMASDIVRYEVLYLYGGIYSDTDTECLKPFDDLLSSEFAGIEMRRGDEVDIAAGVLGAFRGSRNIKQVMDNLPGHVRRHKNLMNQTGPRMLEKEIQKFRRPFKLFERHAFYPFYYTEKDKYYDKSHEELKILFPNSYAVHYWEGSWKDDDCVASLQSA